MEILGIGTDIVHIKRIDLIWQSYGVRFAKHILTSEELEQLQQSKQPARFLAKRFAAKEAVAKAIGTGFRGNVYLSQIGVCNNELGKPTLLFLDKTKEFFMSLGSITAHVSISDEAAYAVAFVLLTRDV